jgi:hypothetical protein
MVSTMNRRLNLTLEAIRRRLAGPAPTSLTLQVEQDDDDEPMPDEDDGTGDEMPEPGEDIPIDERAVLALARLLADDDDEDEPEPREPDGDEVPIDEVPWCGHC